MTTLQDMLWGIRQGVRLATIISTLTVLVGVSLGLATGTWSTFFAYAVLVYIAGGIIGGLLLGALRPLGRRMLCSMLIGAIVIAPFFYGSLLIHPDVDVHSTAHLLTTAFCSLLLGSYAGWAYWKKRNEDDRQGADVS
jgi:hypothetical protein